MGKRHARIGTRGVLILALCLAGLAAVSLGSANQGQPGTTLFPIRMAPHWLPRIRITSTCLLISSAIASLRLNSRFPVPICLSWFKR